MHLSVSTCVLVFVHVHGGACRDQKRVSEFLELELIGCKSPDGGA